jgi:hypothetical protein
MIDVHPPDHTPHTWRDFFIHIATIVVGLLIAIGLEQAVVAIQHHRQVTEIREALRQERAQNRRNFAINTAEFREASAYAQNDLLVLRYLQKHPGTPEGQLPGVLEYHIRYQPMVDAEWKTAQQTGATDLMPRAEVTANDSLYDLCSRINSDAFVIFHNANLAKQYRSLDPNLSHLTPLQIEAQIKLTQDTLISLYEWGVMLETLGSEFPDFAAKPTPGDLESLSGSARSPQDTQGLLPAQQLTDARTKAFAASTEAADKAAQTK